MRLIIAHGHIFKNAGSTLDWSLQRSFGDDFLDHREDVAMRRDGTRHLLEMFTQRPSLTALSSHHLTGELPELADTRIVPLYLVRHPLERIRSVYEFERQQQADTPGARAAKEKSFQEYVAWRMEPEVPRTIRNYQTVYLAGRHTMKTSLSPGMEVFTEAFNRLQNNSITGTVERYDETMVVIEDQLGELLPSLDLAYVRQNVTARSNDDRPRDKVQQVLAKLGDLSSQVIDQNSLDLALHSMANEHLDRVIADIPDFQQKLEAFRARCTALA